jgi:hypothetical protein
MNINARFLYHTGVYLGSETVSFEKRVTARIYSQVRELANSNFFDLCYATNSNVPFHRNIPLNIKVSFSECENTYKHLDPVAGRIRSSPLSDIFAQHNLHGFIKGLR